MLPGLTAQSAPRLALRPAAGRQPPALEFVGLDPGWLRLGAVIGTVPAANEVPLVAGTLAIDPRAATTLAWMMPGPGVRIPDLYPHAEDASFLVQGLVLDAAGARFTAVSQVVFHNHPELLARYRVGQRETRARREQHGVPPIGHRRARPERPLVIAHRGLPEQAPENTLPAIAAAFAAGADVVEVDVRSSGDGVPVLMHDALVDRTTDGSGLVELMPLTEVRALDAGSWMAARFAGTRVPTLSEALRQLPSGRGRLLLDVKTPYMARAIAEVLELAGLPPDAVWIWRGAAFDDHPLFLPRTPVLWAAQPERWDGATFASLAAEGAVGFDLCDGRFSEDFVRAAQRHGMAVFVHVVNDAARMRELVAMGVDGIETDRPEVACAVIAAAAGEDGSASAGCSRRRSVLAIVATGVAATGLALALARRAVARREERR